MSNKSRRIAHIGMTVPLGSPSRTPGAMERIMKMTLQPIEITGQWKGESRQKEFT
jgi:hypothetical protein